MSPPPTSSGVTGWVKLALGASSSSSSIGDSGAFSAIVATMMPTALASWTGPCADANGAAIGLTHGGAHVPHDSQCNFRGRCERDSTRCHCFSGWTGERCEIGLCPSDCSAHGTCVDGTTCRCDVGYVGKECAVEVPCPRAPSPSGGGMRACSGRGQCQMAAVGSHCVCFWGYEGTACELTSCPAGCHGHGSCMANGTCACDSGYTGPACEEQTCENLAACSGRGVCIKGVCACESGWTGPTCIISECPNDCSGHGVCDVNAGVCTCAEGWSGTDCSASPPCVHHCSGHGMCELGVCYCSAGAYGEACEFLSCPKGCSGRGHCDATTGHCECWSGYGGEDCTSRTCPLDCGKHGICSQGQCSCFGGWSGVDCSLRECPVNCSYPSGICDVATGLCTCAAGFEGPDCAFVGCHPADCSGNGHCQHGACICRPGWRGNGCNEPDLCSAGCGGPSRGRCHVPSRGCACLPGYSGPDCSLLECNNGQGCGPNGFCDQSRGECVCSVSWTGAACSTQLCPNGCSRAGLCVNGTCHCLPGWKGDACDVPACADPFCSGHGSCIRGVCMCDTGFVGTTCDFLGCLGHPPCSGAGRCVEVAQSPPHSTADSHAVMQNGTRPTRAPLLRRSVCECPAGRSGPACERLSCPLAGPRTIVRARTMVEAGEAPAWISTTSSVGNAKLPSPSLLLSSAPLSTKPAASANRWASSIGPPSMSCTGHGLCDGAYGTCACQEPWFGEGCS